MESELKEVNISTNSVKLADGTINKCSEKCAYNFSYPETNLIIRNDGTHLTIKCDNTTPNQVTYNNTQYYVHNMWLTQPSIHNFNGVKADGELMVSHVATKGGAQLYVCVPIVVSDASTAASQYISSIITEASKLAPIESSDTFNYNNSSFTLQEIIPVKPFYNYKMRKNVDVIVFDILDAIPINKDTLTKLQNITDPNKMTMLGEALYYNSAGPNLSKMDGIYISCKPTGASHDLVDIAKPKNNVSFGSYNTSIIFFIKIIIGIIIMIFVFFCISSFFKIVAPKKSHLLPFVNSIGIDIRK